jgi:hypothetical protein
MIRPVGRRERLDDICGTSIALKKAVGEFNVATPRSVRSIPACGGENGGAAIYRTGWPIVLVGRTARDNDTLTFKLASQNDFWLHVAGATGSHVVVRNPEGLSRLPRDTLRFAASLAVGYSKAQRGGQVTVHVARVRTSNYAVSLPTSHLNPSTPSVTPSRWGGVPEVYDTEHVPFLSGFPV